MDRAAMLEALNQAGFDTSLVNDATPDSLLAEFLAFMAPAEEVPAETPPEEVAAMADMTRDEMTAKLTEKGHSADDLAAKSDEEIKALYDQEFPPADAAMAEGEEEEEGEKEEEVAAMSEKPKRKPKAKPARTVNFNESDIRSIVVSVVKPLVQEATKQIRGELGATRAQTKALLADAKREHITAFCESLSKEGKILPAELPSVIERLMRANATQVVKRFSEKGKTVVKTELDLQQDELRARPNVVQMSERVKQPMGATNVDAEVAKVEQNFEAFSEKYRRAGTTKEKMVKAFKTMREKNPEYSADEFLGRK